MGTRGSMLAAAAAALLGAALTVAAPGAAHAQVRADACLRELAKSTLEGVDPTNQGAQANIADTCRRASATARGVEAARARFYAGRAYLRAGNAEQAITQLQIAANVGQDYPAAFARELRAARLGLVQAYRDTGRIEAARNLLADGSLRPSDPAVAYQRAMLSLAELGEGGQEAAFDALKTVFVQDDARLKGTPDDPTQLSPAEIREGRSWLYRLGVTLGQRALQLDAREPEQRRADAQRAIDFLRPVVDAVNASCPDAGPINCGAIGASRGIGVFPPAAAPTGDQLLNVYYSVGVAYLQAAGLQKTTLGLGAASGVGGLAALDCANSDLAPDAARHFQNARFAFDTFIRRSAAGGTPGAAADARWGIGCTILANLSNVTDSFERQRQLAQAIENLSAGPEGPAKYLTLARAQVLQSQPDSARASYWRALGVLNAPAPGAAQPCTRGSFDANRPEIPSRIYVEMARTYFAQAALRTDNLATRSASTELYDRVIGDVVSARPGSLRSAEPNLRCAVSLFASNAEARLTLGHLYLRLGTEAAPLDNATYEKAQDVLKFFERPQADNGDGRAEGLYLLSKRLALIQQQRLGAGQVRSTTDRAFRDEGKRAVQFAAQAYNLTQRPPFRQQACLNQILYGEITDQAFCGAAGQGEDRAEASLYEGMYWLRRGQRESVPARLDSWSRSIQAFNRGVAATLPDQMVSSNHPNLPPQLDLRQLLVYGQRYVLSCVQLNTGDSEIAADEIKSFYWFSGIPRRCGGPPS